MGVDKSYGSGKAKAPKKTTYTDSYIDRGRSATASMGPKAKAVRAEQNRVANIVASKVGEAIGFVTNGPEHTQGYNQLGVLGSKGFVQAAANLSSAVVKRTMINQVRTAISGKAQNMPLVNELTGTSPFMNSAIQNARRELVATTGPGKTYTGMRSLSANIGREMAKDVKKIDISMKALGPTHPLTRADVLAWHRKRDLATALKEESRKALSTKRTPK